jgi:16S rRNA processing protein RimM
VAPTPQRDEPTTGPGVSGVSERLTVGLVRGLRGLRGQVRVELLTDTPEERFPVGATLYREGSTDTLTIVEASAVADGPGWWLRFREAPDRASADALRGVYLEIDKPEEPREPGRWLWSELEGLAVRGTNGEELGRIVEIYRAGGAEVFVVRGPRGEVDIPGVQGIVTDLAPDRGEMIVDMDALALDARPVEDDYVRPRDRRPPNPRRQRKPKAGPEASATREPAVAEQALPPDVAPDAAEADAADVDPVPDSA